MKMKKKILSMFTALTMLMSLIGAMPITANAEDITTISTLAELEAFRNSVNGGNTCASYRRLFGKRKLYDNIPRYYGQRVV